MSEAQINNELMILSNFYGTLAATSGLEKEIYKKCNMNLIRLLDQLQKGTDHLISASSGLIVDI